MFSVGQKMVGDDKESACRQEIDRASKDTYAACVQPENATNRTEQAVGCWSSYMVCF
jgi:hypothetical protein